MESFNRLVIRRSTNPFDVQRIWDAVGEIDNKGRKRVSEDEITKFCSFNLKMDRTDVSEKILNMLQDRLIIQKKRRAKKETTEYVFYTFPDESQVEKKSRHDWYCFSCHKPGKVLTCDSCFRVYHPECLEKNVAESCVVVCPVCQELNSESDELMPEIPKKELNGLLSFICSRLKTMLPMDLTVWIPSSIAPSCTSFTTDRCAAIIQKKQKMGMNVSSTEDNHSLRNKLLIHSPIQLSEMDSKCDRQVYRSLSHFRADSKTLVHNVTVFHGEHSTIADSARVMLREFEQIILCCQCFRRSYEQKDKNWFCVPCCPPHELVYARVSGFPFWPAKVLKIDGDKYHVRFFGTHDWAIIDSCQIRPITADVDVLVPKKAKNTSWLKAFQELEELQKRVNDVMNVAGPVEEIHEEHLVEKQKKMIREMLWTDVRVSLPKLEVVINWQDASLLFGDDVILKCSDLVSKAVSLPLSKSEGPGQHPAASSGHEMQCQSGMLEQTIVEQEVAILKERIILRESQHECQCSSLEQTAAELRQEIINLKESHIKEISEAKKREWCNTCEKPGIYHCCQKYFYCSTECQTKDWPTHKKRRFHLKSKK